MIGYLSLVVAQLAAPAEARAQHRTRRAVFYYVRDLFFSRLFWSLAVSGLFILARQAAPLQGAPQTEKPEWCRALPRPEYRALQRVLPDDPWFEMYKVAPGVFAIYEPHQAEETISYLIVGNKQAVLFDTGMGISDIHRVTTKLTSRPVVVLNSHTHDDHVGGNWQFAFVYGVGTDFSRENAQGSRGDDKADNTPQQICGGLAKGFNPKTYATKPWRISHFIHDRFKVNRGCPTLEVLTKPGHTTYAI